MATERVSWPNKYEEGTEKNGVNWTAWLGIQTISDAYFEVLTNDITLSEDAFDASNSSVRISGGVPGIAEVLCTIETSQNNTYQVIAEFMVLALPT